MKKVILVIKEKHVDKRQALTTSKGFHKIHSLPPKEKKVGPSCLHNLKQKSQPHQKPYNSLHTNQQRARGVSLTSLCLGFLPKNLATSAILSSLCMYAPDEFR